MAAGTSESDVLATYPRLTHDGIIACIAHASDLFRSERVFPPSA
ncbi:MAG: hypothetical protein IT373_17225 [Polyangiaceae bacterium]|nr:hypothetical protein [Polyangiaceae bacterium]